MKKRLGIGFIGSGFITKFHIRSFLAVRDADILGVWSPNGAHAREAALLANEIGVGEAQGYDSIEALVNAPGIEALWICGPNFARIENIEKLSSAIHRNPGKIRAIACEKPLGRNVAEAKLMVQFVEQHKLLHGYLEDQLFEPAIQRGREIIWRRGAALCGRPYLARAAEEHSGPHMPWFWQGSMQGGGVLNDMMCHSVEVARYLLTEPGKPRNSITPIKISASIDSLKTLTSMTDLLCQSSLWPHTRARKRSVRLSLFQGHSMTSFQPLHAGSGILGRGRRLSHGPYTFPTLKTISCTTSPLRR